MAAMPERSASVVRTLSRRLGCEKDSCQPKPKSPLRWEFSVSYVRWIWIGMPASGMVRSVKSKRKLPRTAWASMLTGRPNWTMLVWPLMSWATMRRS